MAHLQDKIQQGAVCTLWNPFYIWTNRLILFKIWNVWLWNASSKTCHKCKSLIAKLTLDIRKWQCKNCNTKHDRDINVAINIKLEGIDVTAGWGFCVSLPLLVAIAYEARSSAFSGGVVHSERSLSYGTK